MCFSWWKIPEGVLVSLVPWGQAKCLPLAVEFYCCFRRLVHPLCVVVAVQAGLSFSLIIDVNALLSTVLTEQLNWQFTSQLSVHVSYFPPGSKLWRVWGRCGDRRWTKEDRLTLVCTERLDTNLLVCFWSAYWNNCAQVVTFSDINPCRVWSSLGEYAAVRQQMQQGALIGMGFNGIFCPENLSLHCLFLWAKE